MLAKLVAPHIGRQTTHRARGRGRGYSEAASGAQRVASPRAAGPPLGGRGAPQTRLLREAAVGPASKIICEQRRQRAAGVGRGRCAAEGLWA